MSFTNPVKPTRAALARYAGGEGKRQEGSSSFFEKKEPTKLLSICRCQRLDTDVATRRDQGEKSFLLYTVRLRSRKKEGKWQQGKQFLFEGAGEGAAPERDPKTFSPLVPSRASAIP